MNHLPELEHEATEDCWCGPRCEAVFDDDGAVLFYLYTHHSVNGGELAAGVLEEPPVSG